MNRYDVMYNSIQKNIQELCEFLVDDFKTTSFYDLVDKMVFLNNVVATLERKNNKLYKEIKKDIEGEEV